jgi:hypothetical protein
LKNYKSQIDKLNLKKSKNVKSVNIQEFQNTILEMDKKKILDMKVFLYVKRKSYITKNLIVLSEDGAKRSIIAGIIKPIIIL